MGKNSQSNKITLRIYKYWFYQTTALHECHKKEWIYYFSQIFRSDTKPGGMSHNCSISVFQITIFPNVITIFPFSQSEICCIHKKD